MFGLRTTSPMPMNTSKHKLNLKKPPQGCIVCGESGRRKWFEKHTENGVYPICRCDRCGSAFVWPRPAEEHIQAHYAAESFRRRDTDSPALRLGRILERETAHPNSTLDAEAIARECARYSPGRHLLDIGAGYGFMTAAARRRGFDVTALEPSPACREVFRLLNGFEPEDTFLDDDFASRHAGRFHAVILSQVLEHIPDLHACLRRIQTLLVPGGLLVAAVPQFGSLTSLVQDRQDMFIIPPEHLNFFTGRGLRRLLERSGFTGIAAASYSRFDRGKISRRFRPRIMGTMMENTLRSVLHIADRFEKGMYVRGCFRKKLST